MQPLKLKQHEHLFMVFNGEIYNYKQLHNQYGFNFETSCDTEIILHLYAKGGIEFCVKQLYGVFAFILADVKNNKVFYARDTFGVRPLFTIEHLPGSENTGFGAAASEVKGLMSALASCPPGSANIKPHLPGHFTEFNLTQRGSLMFVRCERFHQIGTKPAYIVNEPDSSLSSFGKIKHALTNAVNMRMMADCKIGCMLSGGLDSSLVCALVKQHMAIWGFEYDLETFAIGLDKNSTDLVAAQKVADHIGTKHHSIVKTTQDFLSAVDDVIRQIESHDVTTVRASVGMYLVSQYIKENSQCKIIFSGEGADELCQGYIYFHKAPSPSEASEESDRLLNDLYLYDVLRADRTTAGHGLELRVPFLDHYFVHTFMSLSDDEKKPINQIEKYTLRKSFDGAGLIPDDILWRPKEAFSDGVSSIERPWFAILQDHIETIISDDELASATKTYKHNAPKTKEALYYRKKFAEFYPTLDDLIPYTWLPKWCGEQVNPSARVLSHFQA